MWLADQVVTLMLGYVVILLLILSSLLSGNKYVTIWVSQRQKFLVRSFPIAKTKVLTTWQPMLSGEKKKWRDDGKCGDWYPLPDGSAAECDPYGERPCCLGMMGECSNAVQNCTCASCVDYRAVQDIRRSGKSCTAANVAGFLKNVCFDEQNKVLYNLTCSYSDVQYKTFYDFSSASHVPQTGASSLCDNDPYAYQACGFTNAKTTDVTTAGVLCGGYLCEKERGSHKYV